MIVIDDISRFGLRFLGGGIFGGYVGMEKGDYYDLC